MEPGDGIDDLLLANRAVLTARASWILRGKPLVRLEPDGLLNQAYIRTREARGDVWEGTPAGFRGYMTTVMWSIVNEELRKLGVVQRHQRPYTDLQRSRQAACCPKAEPYGVEGIEVALAALHARSADLHQVVDRCLCGLDDRSIAASLNLPPTLVTTRRKAGLAFLKRELHRIGSA